MEYNERGHLLGEWQNRGLLTQKGRRDCTRGVRERHGLEPIGEGRGGGNLSGGPKTRLAANTWFEDTSIG